MTTITIGRSLVPVGHCFVEHFDIGGQTAPAVRQAFLKLGGADQVPHYGKMQAAPN